MQVSIPVTLNFTVDFDVDEEDWTDFPVEEIRKRSRQSILNSLPLEDMEEIVESITAATGWCIRGLRVDT